MYILTMASYIGLIRKDDNSDFGVDFPDFPGCISAGSSMPEALQMGAEALNFHVEGMIADGLPLPISTSVDDILAQPNSRGARLFLVVLEGERTL